ncbi:hypothetical protein CGRA01v4_10872 [Colletotrichum graminicola]|nr:hypothetical protein CGRA01v4_10872 [Colletotrichum graminicola]
MQRITNFRPKPCHISKGIDHRGSLGCRAGSIPLRLKEFCWNVGTDGAPEQQTLAL